MTSKGGTMLRLKASFVQRDVIAKCTESLVVTLGRCIVSLIVSGKEFSGLSHTTGFCKQLLS